MSVYNLDLSLPGGPTHLSFNSWVSVWQWKSHYDRLKELGNEERRRTEVERIRSQIEDCSHDISKGGADAASAFMMKETLRFHLTAAEREVDAARDFGRRLDTFRSAFERVGGMQVDAFLEVAGSALCTADLRAIVDQQPISNFHRCVALLALDGEINWARSAADN